MKELKVKSFYELSKVEKWETAIVVYSTSNWDEEYTLEVSTHTKSAKK